VAGSARIRRPLACATSASSRPSVSPPSSPHRPLHPHTISPAEAAVKQKLLPSNPCAEPIRRPQAGQGTEMHPWSAAELAAFLAWAGTSRAAPAWVDLAYTRMRAANCWHSGGHSTWTRPPSPCAGRRADPGQRRGRGPSRKAQPRPTSPRGGLDPAPWASCAPGRGARAGSRCADRAQRVVFGAWRPASPAGISAGNGSGRRPRYQPGRRGARIRLHEPAPLCDGRLCGRSGSRWQQAHACAFRN